MEYALGAGLGVAMLCPNRPVVFIEGDGGFQMNIQELQTIKSYDINMKIKGRDKG